MIVEFYFQDYLAVGFIAVFAVAILFLCISLKYLIVKSLRWLETHSKKLDYYNWTEKIEKPEREAVYFFGKNRNYW